MIALYAYDFGLRLKELRDKHKLTQKQVADKLDVTESLISSYERGIAIPPSDVLKKLAIIYKSKTDFILNLESRDFVYVDGLSKRQIEIIENLIDELRSSNKA